MKLVREVVTSKDRKLRRKANPFPWAPLVSIWATVAGITLFLVDHPAGGAFTLAAVASYWGGSR